MKESLARKNPQETESQDHFKFINQEKGSSFMEVITKLSHMDIVGSVFAYSELETFTSDRKFIHTFFLDSKEKKEFSELLNDFVFSEVDIYPFSRPLELTINKLALAKSIVAENPVYGRFRMKDDARLKEKNIIDEKITDKEKLDNLVGLLVKLGNDFKDASDKYDEEEEQNKKDMVIHFAKQRS